ncbi:hypothetical protein PVK06_047050 [Gossypium arboreum]|uniref:Pentatricopeptide repeat-containing protein n=1 Tax=Gossypium arboreum TaxID=29729 RepID=A0ABR0MCF5_GOSAR|nr:hypothetical protein PVK06_047050 [Gossypium arboreum]
MVSEYIRAGKPKSSLQLFLELVGLGIEPSGFTLSDKGLFDSWNVAFMGIMKRKFDSDNVIMTALIDFYGRNGQLNEVCQMFDELPEPDTICLDSVISALTRNGLCKEVLSFFYFIMKRKYGLILDGLTLATILTACGSLGWFEAGEASACAGHYL